MITRPFDIHDHAHLLVRRAVHRNDEVADAIFDIASADRTDWDLSDWGDLLDELDQVDKTVGDWLASRQSVTPNHFDPKAGKPYGRDGEH